MIAPSHARPDDLSAALGAYVVLPSDRAARHVAHVAALDPLFLCAVMARVRLLRGGAAADPLTISPHDIADAALRLALGRRRAA